MDAEIGTTYHRIWMDGPKSAEEPPTSWNGFVEIAAGKRCYEKSAVIPLPFFDHLTPPQLTPVFSRETKMYCDIYQPLFIKVMDEVYQADEIDELSKVIGRLAAT
ncbi:hypothetical protein AVEN_108808-1 [Araneus ventricosus]|uniref:Uncharacterized protein n=1 Tax=Araneus ventricosus TaxID=182803 RepID=A0A4Y2CDD4_ARAVE|nr:hypothetical protein AVEN_108808-1 [Araneus ventricosus]